MGPVGEGRLAREEGDRSMEGGGNWAARHSSSPCCLRKSVEARMSFTAMS